MLHIAKPLIAFALAAPVAALRDLGIAEIGDEAEEKEVKIHVAEKTAGIGPDRVPNDADEYVVRWVDRYGGEAAQGKQWVIPVKCPRAGLWMEVSGQIVNDPEYRITEHCTLVRCKMNGKIDAMHYSKCPTEYSSYSHSYHKPDRLAEASDMVQLTHKDGRYEVVGHYRRGSSAIGSGPDSAYVEGEGLHVGKDIHCIYAKEFAAWTFRDPRYDPRCEKTERLNPHHLPVPKDEESRGACLKAAQALKDECVTDAKFWQKASAFVWKCGEKRGVWHHVADKYDECKEWEVACPAELSAEHKKRIEDKDTGFWSGLANYFNAQHQCEKKLREEAERSERKCESRGYDSFCTSDFVQECLKTKAELENEE